MVFAEDPADRRESEHGDERRPIRPRCPGWCDLLDEPHPVEQPRTGSGEGFSVAHSTSVGYWQITATGSYDAEGELLDVGEPAVSPQFRHLTNPLDMRQAAVDLIEAAALVQRG